MWFLLIDAKCVHGPFRSPDDAMFSEVAFECAHTGRYFRLARCPGYVYASPGLTVWGVRYDSSDLTLAGDTAVLSGPYADEYAARAAGHADLAWSL